LDTISISIETLSIFQSGKMKKTEVLFHAIFLDFFWIIGL